MVTYPHVNGTRYHDQVINWPSFMMAYAIKGGNELKHLYWTQLHAEMSSFGKTHIDGLV